MKNSFVGKMSFFTLAISSIAVLAMEAAHAQNAAWVQPAGGFYEEPSNWVPSVVPGANNDILINVGTGYNIGFLSDQSAGSLSISNNLDLTFSSGGPSGVERKFNVASDATIDRASLTLGAIPQGVPLHLDVDGRLNMAGGNLSVLNGAQLDTLPSLAASNTIEGNGGVASRVEVAGTDATGRASRWTSGGDIIIGRDGGAARLDINGGGQVSTDGLVSVGAHALADGSSLEVRGTSADGAPSSLTSSFMQLGFLSGAGLSVATAQVADGAQVTTGGVQVSLDSKLIIEGEDINRNPSRWDAGTFDVYTGFLDILGGGHFTSGSATLNRVSIAKVDGVAANGRPSRWDIDGNLTLGNDDGIGAVLVDSGLVTSDTAQIGFGTGESLISVEGIPNAGGAWENSGDVSVGGSLTGPEAKGILRLNNEHARVDIGGTLTVWGPGSVEINGGDFKADVVDDTHGGTFEFNTGTLSVNRFDGNLLNAAGTFAPGVDAATGSTLVDGNYTQQSGSTLALDIAGTGPGSTHDLINITGDAQIDGLLELSLVEGFTPNFADEFTLLAADSLFGFFDNVGTGQRLDTVDGRGSFAVHYGIGSAFDESRVVLSDFQMETVTADLNMDGFVDGLDLGILLGNFETIAAPSGGELNGTDPVDGLDLGILLGNWDVQTLGAVSSLPEPTGWALLSLGSIFCITNLRTFLKEQS